MHNKFNIPFVSEYKDLVLLWTENLILTSILTEYTKKSQLLVRLFLKIFRYPCELLFQRFFIIHQANFRIRGIYRNKSLDYKTRLNKLGLQPIEYLFLIRNILTLRNIINLGLSNSVRFYEKQSVLFHTCTKPLL